MLVVSHHELKLRTRCHNIWSLEAAEKNDWQKSAGLLKFVFRWMQVIYFKLTRDRYMWDRLGLYWGAAPSSWKKDVEFRICFKWDEKEAYGHGQTLTPSFVKTFVFKLIAFKKQFYELLNCKFYRVRIYFRIIRLRSGEKSFHGVVVQTIPNTEYISLSSSWTVSKGSNMKKIVI